MPVHKFRSVEEAERALWLEPGDPRIWDGVLRRWELHRAFAPPERSPRPGVYRYRSVTEKQDDERRSAV